MDNENETIFSIEELRQLLYPVFQEHKIKRAVLFGSYCKGLATSKSDVDILVDSGLKGLKFVGFMDEIQESLQGKEVDIFDIKHIEPGSQVEQEINRTGIEIYAQ